MTRKVSERIVKRVSEIRNYHRARKTINKLLVIMLLMLIVSNATSALVVEDGDVLIKTFMHVLDGIIVAFIITVDVVLRRRKKNLIKSFGKKEFLKQKAYI